MRTKKPSLDHLVLPVRELPSAETRYEALGFQVAPRGEHPFGTFNACIYLADGTFLEPLSVADPARAKAAIAEGNVFVSHDATFRTRVGDEGLSAVVLTTPDANADHSRFVDEGISCGAMLRFARPFIGAEGQKAKAEFLLAFAQDRRAPDMLFFSCERVNAPSVDRKSLTVHSNSVVGLRNIVMLAPEAHHFETFLKAVSLSSDISSDARSLKLGLGDTHICVCDPDALGEEFGIAKDKTSSDPTLQAVAVEFAVQDLEKTRKMLEENAIAFSRHRQMLVVPPAPGQGVYFLFSEKEI